MNMRYLMLLAILNGAILTMAGCGQKGALFLPEEQPEELPSESPQTQPEEPAKP